MLVVLTPGAGARQTATRLGQVVLRPGIAHAEHLRSVEKPFPIRNGLRFKPLLDTGIKIVAVVGAIVLLIIAIGLMRGDV